MPNLKKLKERLEKLPERRTLREYAESFGKYTQKIELFAKTMERTHKDMLYASKVTSKSKYEKKVLSELKKAVREAKKLYKEIEEVPKKIKSRATDNKIIRMGECTKKADTQCQDIWNNEIENSVAKWEKLAGVVQDIGAKGGREFKQAVDNLKRQTIPQNDNDVNQVKAYKEKLQKGITSLGLEGPFGKFLEASVAEGASLQDLLKDEIRAKIDEHELWDFFRVRFEQ